MIDAQATAKYVRTSAQKAGLVLELIQDRGELAGVLHRPQRLDEVARAAVAALCVLLPGTALAQAAQPPTMLFSSAPPVAVVSADTATNAPEQHPLELLMPTAASETAQVEPPAAAPLPPPRPLPPTCRILPTSAAPSQ